MTDAAAAGIRPARLADAAAIAAVYAPYVTDAVASFELDAPDATELGRRMAAPYPWLVAERGGAVTGYAYAGPHHPRAAYRWSVNVSVYLAGSEQRRGTGRALYGELFRLLRALGYVNAFAGITLPNPASVGLHEAVGFSPVGVYAEVGYKFGRWWDVGWWQLALASRPAHPVEPRPWRLEP